MSDASTSKVRTAIDIRAMELKTVEHLPVYKAAQNGDWEVVKKWLQKNDHRTIISMISENIFHVIIGSGCDSTAFLREMINDDKFDKTILYEETKNNGTTTLIRAAVVGNTEAAKILVEKAPELLTIADWDGFIPVYVAAQLGHKETTRYLFNETKKRPDHTFKYEPTDNKRRWGVLLLNNLITAAFYDIANDLLDAFPELACGMDRSGSAGPLDAFSIRALGGKHNEALQLIKKNCEKICNNAVSLNQTPTDFLWRPLHRAAQLGTYEIVTEIINACPYIVWLPDGHGRSIYHLAVMYRHERIYNLIQNWGPSKHRIADIRGSKDGNNILHLAGLLGTTTRSRVSGAALQMQRELQWFKQLVPHSGLVYFVTSPSQY